MHGPIDRGPGQHGGAVSRQLQRVAEHGRLGGRPEPFEDGKSIEVNGVREVVNTWFSDAADGISVHHTVLRPPFEILAIGGPSTMATAMRIPGGVADTVESQDGSLVITELDKVEIRSVVNLSEPDPNVTVTD